jgi:hypothetical protein
MLRPGKPTTQNAPLWDLLNDRMDDLEIRGSNCNRIGIIPSLHVDMTGCLVSGLC